MPLILNIDTATELASVCLSNNEEILALKENSVQKEHASFIHVAIKEVMDRAGKPLKDIDAVAVTAGPGSYTGLRVGMATAKGLCYALGKPLITINTLEVMTHAAIEGQNGATTRDTLFCPMIDARRMEVFTALYNSSLKELLSPCALILDSFFFNKWLDDRKILFFGNGSKKFKDIADHKNASFIDFYFSASHLSTLANKCFNNHQFANLAYAEPLYIKEFHSNNLKPDS
ncbi:MAG TPA: tRNA (adenosine(37)-N6)-threonylcarbamoyltransferase complex dimerization subunit type 1 TsaB [Segetibacter sp.]